MQNDPANLFYLVLLLLAIIGWFITQNRVSLGKLAQQVLAWALIFAGAMAVVALWDDISGAITPQQSVFGDQGRIELPRASDGHYYVTADVNGVPVRFTVDTGASQIVLSQSDARAIGVNTDNLAFFGRAYTANGEVRTAPIRLDSFAIGPIRDTNLRAVVNQGEMDGSLLGMSYLQRYSEIKITDGALTLVR